jgi:hypothetical protein
VLGGASGARAVKKKLARKFRYIDRRHGSDSLSTYERDLLEADFDITLSGYYALVPLTKEEFEKLVKEGAKWIG